MKKFVCSVCGYVHTAEELTAAKAATVANSSTTANAAATRLPCFLLADLMDSPPFRCISKILCHG